MYSKGQINWTLFTQISGSQLVWASLF